MIARCDYCDAEAARKGYVTRMGYRYNPRVTALSRLHCGYCAGPLRAKRPGETESNIVQARLGAPKAVRT